MRRGDNIDLAPLVPFRDDFEYKEQRRKKPSSEKLTQRMVAGADFETKDGYAWLYTYSQFENGEYIDRFQHFSGTIQEPDKFADLNRQMFGSSGTPFTIKELCRLHFETGHKWKMSRKNKKGIKKVKRGSSIPQLWFFNLQYDAQAIIKTLPEPIITQLLAETKVFIDTEDWSLVHLTQNKGFWLDDEENKIGFNRYFRITYLPKKWLSIEPILHYTKGVKWGALDCWDIRQFCGGGSLNSNSIKYLSESKLDFSRKEMSLMGRHNKKSTAYTLKVKDKFIEYALKDSNLTARLAWLKVNDFESNDVRMVKPYSLASVAERACYDSSLIPTMNNMMNQTPNVVRAFWTSYQGGHFEARGAGYFPSVQCYDITSAYPHIMYFIPDIESSVWVGSFFDDPKDSMTTYLEQHKKYNPSCFEAYVEFPSNRVIYPAAKTSPSFGCLTNPQKVAGWFTGDEIIEFQKWGATIHIEQWCAMYPKTNHEEGEDVEDGIRYPFRPFIEKFYRMKMAQDILKKNNDPAYDEAKRNVAKVSLNSIYGKTCQAIEQYMKEKRVTGQMWSSVYSSIITAGCRMRLAEFIRVNGYNNTLSVATDGIILESGLIAIPQNENPVFIDEVRTSLGDWENDGEGSLTLMMSGVYSVLLDKLDENRNPIQKTTFRGSYSLFINEKYGNNWFEFCSNYEDKQLIERTATIDPYERPYSLGEARVRKDFSLTNQFRVINIGIRAQGDSNKRNWRGKPSPETFGDLVSKWFESSAWERQF